MKIKLKEPEEWPCFKCGHINPNIKKWRKRKEYLGVCLKCGAKRLPRVV